LCALVVGGGTALLGGCSTNNNISYGTAVVTMSDVSGDFTSYIVNIGPITLTRSDGVIVEPLAQPEAVDLVKLHDLAELVAAPAVPVGTYTTLTLTLDYSNAAITVDVNGVPTTVVPVNSTSGAPMSVSTLTVTFDPQNQLVINAGACTRLALDINLAASNTVNLSASPATVTVRPLMTATMAPADQTVMRARGILVIAQPSSSDYIVNMRPFNDPVSALGALTVNTTSSTYFNINGVTYTGAAGLTAMQSLLVSTPIAAYGTLGSFSTITPGFNATAVYAGTSLESPVSDYLTGIVSAVSGAQLTVHGATYVPRIGALTVRAYYPDIPVTVGPATIVSEDGVAASGVSTQSISVGQLITVSGLGTIDSTSLLLTSIDATGQAAGAAQSQVRLRPTPVWGTLNSAAAGSLSLNVLSLGNFAPGVFTFTGTGATSANDAVPASYAVSTPGIDESATPAGTLLEAVGVVTPFGSAPPDFSASAVTAGASIPQTLVVEWENGGAASPFSSASSAGLVVDLSNANLSSTVRYIASGPTRTDLTTLPASPTIAFATGGTLTLAVGGVTAIQVFNDPSRFATQLSSSLNGTNLVYRLACVGQYSSTTNTFTATQVAVNL
jgi:hypothetical protein